MAKTLVNQMSEAWKPERYGDEYRSALMKLIDKKVASGGKSLPSEGPRGKKATNVIDLAAVLQQSLKDATKQKKSAATEKRSVAGRRHNATGRFDPALRFHGHFNETGRQIHEPGQGVLPCREIHQERSGPLLSRGGALPFAASSRPADYPHPISRQREGEKFYAKNAPRFALPWIKTFSVRHRHGRAR